MALDMTPEQRETGKANFHRVVGQLAEMSDKQSGVTRRDFMKGLLATGAALPVSAAAYYGYEYGKVKGRPVRAALIGAGDEGGVLVGEHNPDYTLHVQIRSQPGAPTVERVSVTPNPGVAGQDVTLTVELAAGIAEIRDGAGRLEAIAAQLVDGISLHP